MEVYSDNGPQFLSKEFRDFGTLFDFVHVTSSPRFPRSNGLSEKGVQIVKRVLKKSTYADTNFFLGLLNYRTTPLEDGNSLADILMGRRLRSRLPDFGSVSQVDVRKHRKSTPRGVTCNLCGQVKPSESTKMVLGPSKRKCKTAWHRGPTKSSRRTIKYCERIGSTWFQRLSSTFGQHQPWVIFHAQEASHSAMY
ncbi:uncharacterized protein LOC135369159 [Ornithodoros turicata]|uniref:uncharacterized protein LOC135369159 n=1 Tax=Ornithodoros turicata TaxID=34597 RepID=UPI0031389627